jgi:hypothetical protein
MKKLTEPRQLGVGKIVESKIAKCPHGQSRRLEESLALPRNIVAFYFSDIGHVNFTP